jgi:hypothetical protein
MTGGGFFSILHNTPAQIFFLYDSEISIDFQKLNFTRKQGGDHTFRISPTDDAVKFDFWKSIVCAE